MTKQEFITKLAENAKIVCKERGYGYAQFATCCAQACCESAYGQSAIMSKANAYFGIKATKSWVTAAKYGGLVYNSKTKECYDGKNYTTISACFRAYASLSDSVRDYFDLLSAARYRASLKAGTVAECIKIIHEGGYATSPTYQSTIINFYNNIKSTIDNVWNGVYNKVNETKVSYPTIRRGTCSGKSQVVKTLQTLLNRFGYGLVVDGCWGSLTQGAVLDFQRTHNLAVDGIVGPLTWGKLQEGD